MLKPTPAQLSADSHKQQCFMRPSPQSNKQQCFPRPSAQPHSLQAITGPSLPKSCIPSPTKGKPSFTRPSVLARPPLPCHLGKLPSCILCPPGVNRAVTVYPSEEDLLLHLSTLVPLSIVSAKQDTQMPEEPCPAPTPPVTPKEELEAEPGLSRLPDQYCFILTLPQAAYHLQWGSPHPLTRETTGYHLQQPVHTLPQKQWVQYRWHRWQSIHRWLGWNRWLPHRSRGRFITPTDRFTNSRDRHGHAYTPRCLVDQQQGQTDAWPSKEDALTMADKVSHRKQIISRPFYLHYRTNESCFQDHPAPSLLTELSSLQDNPVLPPRWSCLLTGPTVHKLLSNIAFKALQDHCIDILPVFLFSTVSRPSSLTNIEATC